MPASGIQHKVVGQLILEVCARGKGVNDRRGRCVKGVKDHPLLLFLDLV